MKEFILNNDQFLDFVNLASGFFAPLTGFVNKNDFISIAENITLTNGEVFSFPIILSAGNNNPDGATTLKAIYNGKEIGFLEIEEIYTIDAVLIHKLFKTNSLNHPGLKKIIENGFSFIAGKPVLTDKNIYNEMDILTPEISKDYFQKMNWKNVVGFQTRNPIHRAHEHLQRIALEVGDALFINPLVGWKKNGDFTEEAINAAYSVMIKDFYPSSRVYFKGLRTSMKYAGPREAILHAIIRRNLGCSTFIVGRDHAGVGNFYEAYEAHELIRHTLKKHDIGINFLLLNEPVYCTKCEQMVSSNTCKHQGGDIKQISGTLIRELINNKEVPPSYMMRKEVFQAIIEQNNIFIG
jgi:sulfate adenylyltransferase